MFPSAQKIVIVTNRTSVFCVHKLNYANENLDVCRDVSPNSIL